MISELEQYKQRFEQERRARLEAEQILKKRSRELTEKNQTQAETIDRLWKEVSRNEKLSNVLKFQQFALDEHAIVSITDADGNIIYVNQKFCESSGYTREEMIGQSHSIIRSDDWSPEFYASVWASLATGKTWRGDIKNKRKDGSEYWVTTTIVPFLDKTGKPYRYVAFRTDITERIMAEQAAIRAKEEAEAANEAKSAFLAKMSHEIRTPMNGVIGLLDVLAHNELAEDERKLVETMRVSAQSLLSIIDDLLDFSKIEAGRLELVLEPLNVEKEIDEVCGLLHRVAQEKRVELSLQTDPKIPKTAIGDSLRLRQVLINLIGNAIKFSAKSDEVARGRVDVRARCAKIEHNQAWVEFAVEDNGVGMDEHTLNRIFRPFEQGDNSTKRRFGGTGLGLVITSHLIDVMGGTIEVKSQPNRGSVFSFSLPFEILPNSCGDNRTHDFTSLDCIVVCREPKLREDCALCLEDSGVKKIHQTETLDRALGLVSAGRLSEPACVVLFEDQEMPAQSMKEMIERDTTRNVRYVLVKDFGLKKNAHQELQVVENDIVHVNRQFLTKQRMLNAIAVAVGKENFEAAAGTSNAQVKRKQAQTRDEAIAQGRLILFAEDNEINQEVISHQLNLLGYAADLAADGMEALEKWKSGEYGLVITDLQMPFMDGYELTAKIREEEDKRGTARLPVIALTAHGLRDDHTRCLQSGMDGYLRKPIELDRLKQILEQYLPDDTPSAPCRKPTGHAEVN